MRKMLLTTAILGLVACDYSTQPGDYPPNTVAVTGVGVAPQTIVFTAIGETRQMTATIAPLNATDKALQWESGERPDRDRGRKRAGDGAGTRCRCLRDCHSPTTATSRRRSTSASSPDYGFRSVAGGSPKCTTLGASDFATAMSRKPSRSRSAIANP